MAQESISVLVSLQSSASSDGEPPEIVSLLTSGELAKTDTGYLLRYEETLDGSDTATHVELTLEDGGITMRRSGDFDVNMVFRKGQRYEGQYRTPYGSLGLALFCTQVDYTVEQPAGELFLQYQLDINGQFVAMHELTLCFSAKEG